MSWSPRAVYVTIIVTLSYLLLQIGDLAGATTITNLLITGLIMSCGIVFHKTPPKPPVQKTEDPAITPATKKKEDECNCNNRETPTGC